MATLPQRSLPRARSRPAASPRTPTANLRRVPLPVIQSRSPRGRDRPRPTPRTQNRHSHLLGTSLFRRCVFPVACRDSFCLLFDHRQRKRAPLFSRRQIRSQLKYVPSLFSGINTDACGLRIWTSSSAARSRFPPTLATKLLHSTRGSLSNLCSTSGSAMTMRTPGMRS